MPLACLRLRISVHLAPAVLADDVRGNPCGLCEGAARGVEGKRVPIGEPFYPAGATIMGTDGKTYTTSMPIMVASEAHPNCSCGTVTAITEGEA